MDRDKFSVQQIRPFRKRLSQWTGEKIKGWIEPQTGSTTTTASETEKHSSTAVDSNATALEGHNNPLPSQSSTNPDHHRLQFPVSYILLQPLIPIIPFYLFDKCHSPFIRFLLSRWIPLDCHHTN